MNMIKRLYSKFRQNKLRFFLISLLYAVLFTAVIFLLTFWHYSGEQIGFLKTYIENRVTMAPQNKNIEIYVIQDIERLACVKDYNMTSLLLMRFRDQEPYIPDQEAFEEYKKDAEIMRQEKGLEYKEEYIATAQMIEVRDLLTSHFFLTKGYRVVEGEPILPEDRDEPVALVSKEFAALNHLKIGDTVKTEGREVDTVFGSFAKFDLRIKGIYEFTENGEDFASPSECPANTVFMPIGVISEKNKTTFSEVECFLRDGETLETLKAEIREKCFWDPDAFLWSTTGDWFEVVSGPMESMRTLSSALLMVMMAGILMIVLLLVAFRFRSDSYEIGILLSLGERKGKLVFFVLMEEWIPLAMGVLMAVLLGFYFSGTVGDMVSSGYENSARRLIEDKNATLDAESPETKVAVDEIGTTGRQIQMNMRYDDKYRMDSGTAALFLAITLLVLPGLMAAQTYFKIRFYSVKKILLN